MSGAPLSTTAEDDGARIVLRADDGLFVLRGHDWQRLAVVPALRDLTVAGRLGRVTAGPRP